MIATPDPQAIRLIQLGRVADWQTQAVYHALAEGMADDSPDTIILCQPASPYLCLGYHQIYQAVLDRAACERLHLPVFRRQVGGGATYLDSDQLFYQCVFHHRRVPSVFTAVFAQLLAAPVAALRRLGLNATLSQINELTVDGKRIAGTGGGRIGEACVVVGNILFDFDYTTMAQVWQTPSESFRDLGRWALREHIVTLRELLGAVDMATVEKMLVEEFASALQRPLEPGKLTPTEMDHARTIAARLRSPDYLALHRDRPRLKSEPLKIAAGAFIRADEMVLDSWAIRAAFYVCGDVIQAARLESDPPRVWDDVASRLEGVRFQDWQSACHSLICL